MKSYGKEIVFYFINLWLLHKLPSKVQLQMLVQLATPSLLSELLPSLVNEL